jgi:hypothetical protein
LRSIRSIAGSRLDVSPTLDAMPVDVPQPESSTADPARREPPPELAPFADALADHLGVDPIDDIDAVLALAGTAAHQIVRPAAPVAAYLLGAAVAASPGRPVAAIAAEIETFIGAWAAAAARG